MGKESEKSITDLIQEGDAKGIVEFLQQSTLKIAEFVTGFLATEKNDKKLIAGRIVQSAINFRLLTQLGREIAELRDNGKIKEDYFATHKSQASLYELLRFLDEQVPDEELFAALKSIFFTGVSAEAGERDEVIAYEFLQTAKNLSGTEILILKANFEIAQGKSSDEVKKTFTVGSPASISDRQVWRKVIAVQMGYGDLDAIVSKYEQNLESLGLIVPRRVREDLSDGFNANTKFRLTDTGYKFCEYITNYP